MKSRQAALAWARVVKWWRSSSSVSNVAKKLSVTALSKQSATLPVKVRMAADLQQRLHVGDIGCPHPVRRARSEGAVDQIVWWHHRRIPAGQPAPAAPVHPFKPGGAHQPGDPLAADAHAEVIA
jgi:hypothetical protein